MSAIATMRAVVLDCPDPRALAEFYRALVGGDITYADALGARRTDLQPGIDEDSNWRVYLDPVGHPFCLCWD
jgi:hypothetical protein